MNNLNQLSGSRRRLTFCRNDDYRHYLQIKEANFMHFEEASHNRCFFNFYHYFYFYLISRSMIKQTDNSTIKSAKHFKKCLRQATVNLHQYLNRNLDYLERDD